MSVLAECFQVDLGISKQMTIDSINKDDCEIIKEYLINVKLESTKLIDAKPIKSSNNNFVEVISVDDNSIFGIIGKSNKVEESVMKRVKNQDGESIASTDLNLEYYRFFVFHMPTLKCAVIKNSTAPAFQKLFSDFLFNYKTMRVNRVTVVPIKDKNINDKFNLFKKISKIDMIFAKGSTLQKQMISLESIFDISENSLIKSSVTLDLKDQSVSSNLKDFISKQDLIEYEFDKLEFTGTDNMERQETLEFVKKILTLNIDIDIDYDSLLYSEAYFEQIKKALLESLINS